MIFQAGADYWEYCKRVMAWRDWLFDVQSGELLVSEDATNKASDKFKQVFIDSITIPGAKTFIIHLTKNEGTMTSLLTNPMRTAGNRIREFPKLKS